MASPQDHPGPSPRLADARVPATLTAFTSRLGLPRGSTRRAEDDDSRRPYDDDDNDNDVAVDSDSDSDSDWEDEVDGDGQLLRAGDRAGTVFYDPRGNLVFRRAVVPPPARPQASTLSQMIRQARAASFVVTATASTSTTTSTSTSASTSPLRDALPSPFRADIGLPNPLQCHPPPFGVLPPTPPPPAACGPDRHRPMSPPPPPPVPPPTPCAQTPPPSPLSSRRAGPPSSNAASASASEASTASSSAASSSSRRSSSSTTTTTTSTPSTTHKPDVLHITQLKSSQSFRASAGPRSIVNDEGRTVLLLPFNGACGPRAEPVVTLGPPRQQKAGRAILLRSGSSLRAGELSRSLQRHIEDEHRSRYIFTHYGCRRRAADVRGGVAGGKEEPPFKDDHRRAGVAAAVSPAATTSAAPIFRRTQSAPDMQGGPSRSPDAAAAASTGAAAAAGGHLYPFLQKAVLRNADKAGPAELVYVNDVRHPRSWEDRNGYHDKGW